MPRHKTDSRDTVGFVTYMEKYNKERDHLDRLEKERSKIERESSRLRDIAGQETAGYRNYMGKVEKTRRREGKKQERVDRMLSEILEQDAEHARKHALMKDPNHQHAPRKNHRGALEDGVEETVVICPTEYRRLMDEISDLLSQSIEMVQVVFNNEGITFGSRLHRYIDHTLTKHLIRLADIKTLNNGDITRYKQFAIHQLQYTINQINTMFWKISQIKSEKPKKYKVQKDLLNKWGDTKYSREKHHDRPGLGVPASQPFEYFVPGTGFISPYKSAKGQHGKFYQDQLTGHSAKGESVHLGGGLRSLDEAFYGSGEYFKKEPYIGHDHWGTLDKLNLGPDDKLENPKK